MDTAQKVTHVLTRLSFGARPGDRTQVERIGLEAYIKSQLNPDSLSEPANLSRQINQLSTLKMSPLALFKQYSVDPSSSSEEQREIRQSRNVILQEAMQARLRRAIESPRQLQEVMVDFWFNHFNVFEGKDLTKIWANVYEQSAIRPHALGKFRNLLGATAKHPAMLFYLDNWRNTDPNSKQARGQFNGINENYARELLELHTLGVDGGYSQADVENLARILTGWSVVHPRQSATAATDESGFIFAAERHDPSDKTLLGTTIAGRSGEAGLQEGEEALTLLAQHPGTANHISYKLAQYFVTDAPSNALVGRLADRFRATEGDIKSVLLTLFESDEFWSDSTYQTKFKTPYQYLLSVPRAMGVTDPNERELKRLVGFLNQLNMPLYRCQTPDGYPQTAARWLNPDAMMRRVSLAVGLVTGEPDKRPDPDDLLQTLGNQLSPNTRSAISDKPKYLRSALIVGSPDMMYR